MGDLTNELFIELGNPLHWLRVFLRLTVALLLGGMVGFERQHEHKAAGIRTHMLVALGAALFTIVPIEARMEVSDLSRVIQGIAAGIGFLGAGTILKLGEPQQVKGLTTAGSIWLTAALGIAVGAGLLAPAIVGVFLALVVLFVLHRFERWLKSKGIF
jgi:putative Mg2+ transporter-C (MgtC) family protein